MSPATMPPAPATTGSPSGRATSAAGCGASPSTPATRTSCTPAPPPAACTRASTGPSRGSRSGTTSPRLSMAALAISPANSQVVWAATGETRAGGGELIPATACWRSANGGETWTGANPIPAGNPANLADLRDFRFHAIAAHPTKANVCWVVGGGGAFRTRDSGATWTQYVGNFSDVAYAGTGAARQLFLVRSGPIAGGAVGVVVRLADPDPDPAWGPPSPTPGSGPSSPTPAPPRPACGRPLPPAPAPPATARSPSAATRPTWPTCASPTPTAATSASSGPATPCRRRPTPSRGTPSPTTPTSPARARASTTSPSR